MLTSKLALYHTIVGDLIPGGKARVDRDKAINAMDTMEFQAFRALINDPTDIGYQRVTVLLERLRSHKQFLEETDQIFTMQEATAKQVMLGQCVIKTVKWSIQYANDDDHRKFAVRLWKLRMALTCVDRILNHDGIESSLWPDLCEMHPYIEFVLDAEFGGPISGPTYEDLTGYRGMERFNCFYD
ncbi:hypothetical protein ABW21_db0206850 [Orbilia brochopaga]|nr:hypothetical protein ABW21_db0206850 [Drechslerella brochopaga]